MSGNEIFKEGDLVWCPSIGWGTVEMDATASPIYTLKVVSILNRDLEDRFTSTGRGGWLDIYPTLLTKEEAKKLGRLHPDEA
jgi:hypothetical protein